MTIIHKKGVSLDEINAKIERRKSRRSKHDFEKYVGVLKIVEDPIEIHQRLRDEWE